MLFKRLWWETEFTIFFVFNLWGWDGVEYKEIEKYLATRAPRLQERTLNPHVPGDAQVVLWVIFHSTAYAGMLKNIIKH